MEIIGKVDSDEKRLQMPGTFVTMVCPKCGEKYELEMEDQIYYPGDDEEEHVFYGECEIENGGCDNYWEVPYQVEVFAKITIPPTQGPGDTASAAGGEAGGQG